MRNERNSLVKDLTPLLPTLILALLVLLVILKLFSPVQVAKAAVLEMVAITDEMGLSNRGFSQPQVRLRTTEAKKVKGGTRCKLRSVLNWPSKGVKTVPAFKTPEIGNAVIGVYVATFRGLKEIHRSQWIK